MKIPYIQQVLIGATLAATCLESHAELPKRAGEKIKEYYVGERIPVIVPPAKLATYGEATPEETAEIAKRWFGNIDLTLPELAPVKALADKEQWGAALDSYRDIFLKRVRSIPLVMTAKEFRRYAVNTPDEVLSGQVAFSFPAGLAISQIGQPGAIDWFKPTVDTLISPRGPGVIPTEQEWAQAHVNYPTNITGWSPFNCLASEYVRTGDAKYLKHYLAIWEDYSLRYRTGFDMVNKAGLIKQYDSLNAGLAHGLYLARRINSFVGGMSLLAHNLDPSQNNLINSTALARVLVEMAEGHIAVHLKPKPQFKADGGVPNQKQAAIQSDLWLLKFLPDLTKAPFWTKALREQAAGYYSTQIMPDGTSFEQAIGYNSSIPKFYLTIRDITAPESPAWLEPLKKQGEASTLFLLSVLRNGAHAGAVVRQNADDRSVYSAFINYVKAFPENKDFAAIISHVYGDRETPPPSFTSIAFPYSGYYVLRDGWHPNDSFLYFKASPSGKGHSTQDNTSIQLCAYGRDLLINAGSPVYQPQESNNYFVGSWSKNTVQVDGFGQYKLPMDKNPRGTVANPKKALPNRFMTSTTFDFAEGTYDNGYEDPNVLVKHERQVISLRHRRIWIVTDRMRGEKAPMPADESHTYTQTWHFDISTFPQELKSNKESQILETDSYFEPNVRLRHFGKTPVDYTTFFGYEKDNVYRGWWNYSATRGDGEIKASPETHAIWTGKGEQELVTLIDAGRGKESPIAEVTRFEANGIDGFDATLTDGAKLSYRAALEPTLLSCGGVTSTARNLLTLVSKDGTTEGIVLDGAQTNAKGKTISEASAVFSLTEKGVLKSAAIECPQTPKLSSVKSL